MFWLQGFVAFAVWIAWGALQSRRSQAWRDRALRVPRTKRGLFGAGLLLAALGVLFLGLHTVYSMGDFQGDHIRLPGWILIIATGLAFVAMQTYAMSLLVANALERSESVTEPGVGSSTQGEDSKP